MSDGLLFLLGVGLRLDHKLPDAQHKQVNMITQVTYLLTIKQPNKPILAKT